MNNGVDLVPALISLIGSLIGLAILFLVIHWGVSFGIRHAFKKLSPQIEAMMRRSLQPSADQKKVEWPTIK